METNANNGLISPLELMLKWNRFCDKNNREGDCILLNEERTFFEAFDDEQQASHQSSKGTRVSLFPCMKENDMRG